MADVKVVMNMGALMALSNVVNAAVAEPAAHRVAAAAGPAGDYSVQSTTRASIPGWGRTRVFTATPAAMQREIRTGALARALGGA